MEILALLTIAKPWNQPQCPSPDEWVHTMEFYLAMKKNKVMSFAGKVDGTGTHAMRSKPDSPVFSHMQNLEKNWDECRRGPIREEEGDLGEGSRG
jgi:hypothetical protein